MPAALADRITRSLAEEGRRRADPSEHDDIRRLLGAAPDPGPMPDLVARRIENAFAGELRATPIDDQSRIQELLRATPAPGPMPTDVSARVNEALRVAAAERDAPAENVRPIGSSRATPARSHRLRLVGGLLAAAAAGVVAVTTLPQLMNSQGSAPVANAPATAAPSDYPPGLVDKIHVSNTGTSYTSTAFTQQAGSFAKSKSTQTISPEQAALLGPVATKEGALRCAASIGQSLKDNPNKINVDIATYDSQPALVVVVTKGNTATAWVLNRNCDQSTSPLAGPTTVS
ncbi:hypothetical protein GCM10027579_06200 [Calidifontibacter terrae]